MLIFLRIMLLLLPVVALVLWLRWRAKQVSDDTIDVKKELRRFRITLGVLIAAMLMVGISLRVFDDGAGNTDSVYVPPHVVDGEVVPGRFVPKDEADKPQGND